LLLAYVFVRGSTGLRRYNPDAHRPDAAMVFILATLVFFIMHILPGDPVRSALDRKARQR